MCTVQLWTIILKTVNTDYECNPVLSFLALMMLEEECLDKLAVANTSQLNNTITQESVPFNLHLFQLVLASLVCGGGGGGGGGGG